MVRMLEDLRIMSPGETPESLVAEVAKEAAEKASEAAEERARRKEERKLHRLRRYRADAESVDRVKDPDPPTAFRRRVYRAQSRGVTPRPRGFPARESRRT